ncbi:MAG: peptidylprolyl isomerase [Nitrospira sp.]|jgi:FKBP-type peptidyl-prolyl cis-trans isomerase SlyD|nr:peptidylprolyl isomerase [Nitrospira sp.]
MIRQYSRMAVCVVALAGMSMVGAPLQAETHKGVSAQVVSKGKLVSLEYTLKLDEKNVLESNVGREPMIYTHGAQEIVPGLEKALEGLAIGDKKHVVVKPVDAYGEIDPKAIQEVKKAQVPEKAWKVGSELEAKGPDGQSMLLRVTEVKPDTVVLDFNHPLAGKTLYFDVKVLDVKTPPPASK